MPNFFLEFRWTDAVDILLVASLVYFAITWLRRTRAAMVAGGIVILAALYVAARALGLQLTAWIFQGFFAIFVVIVVVIFQEELRQLFERVAMFSLGRRASAAVADDVVHTLVEALADCARDRVGALVVLPGRQPITRHVRGGIGLNGAVSVPLIKSIFDAHSPGHDGAVVVDKGRITEFAVHLPLSTNFAQLEGVGTRHGAALGLAELSDALCIVVSEERGAISVAQGGELRRLASAHELAEVVRGFVEQQRPRPTRQGLLRRALIENWVEKVAAVGIVLALWYVFVPGARPTESTYPVGIDLLNVPPGLVVEEVTPTSIEVTLAGPTRSFYLFDPQRVQLRLDVALAAAGRRTFQVTEDNVVAPKEFSVSRVSPGRVKISLRKED